MDGPRHRDWDGTYKARDLGGLPTRDGRATRPGALVRSDNLGRLTDAGWAVLWAHGVRTVIDLSEPGESTPDRGARPPGLTTVQLPLHLGADTAFMRAYGHLGSTPRFFPPVLAHRGDRIAALLAAVAGAAPGGVAIHCVAGRDRTGLAAVLLLALAGVVPGAIVADYALSAGRLRPLYARLGRVDEDRAIQAALARLGTTGPDALRAFLADFDLAAALRDAGVPAAELAAIRARLLDRADR